MGSDPCQTVSNFVLGRRRGRPGDGDLGRFKGLRSAGHDKSAAKGGGCGLGMSRIAAVDDGIAGADGNVAWAVWRITADGNVVWSEWQIAADKSLRG